jgi:DNA-directed RNA polymerase specialized sigma subunit
MSQPSLDSIHQRLTTSHSLSEVEYQVLVSELHQLRLDKRVHNAIYDTANPEDQMCVYKRLLQDFASRHAKVREWRRAVLRESDSTVSDVAFEEDDQTTSYGSEELIAKVKLIAKVIQKATTDISGGSEWEEAVGSTEVLLEREEQELFVAYNYARHRLANLLQGNASVPVLCKCINKDLLEIANWILFATDVRELLVDFHSRYLVKCAHGAKQIVVGSVTLREMVAAGARGLTKAINTYDPVKRRGNSGLLGFAYRHVFGGMIERIREITNFTNKNTRPSKQGGRERILESEIGQNTADAGWNEDPIVQWQEAEQSRVITRPSRGRAQSDLSKLDRFVKISELRKAAARATTARDPLEEFLQSQAPTRHRDSCKEETSVGAVFAPPEWQAGWLRRMLRIRYADIRQE